MKYAASGYVGNFTSLDELSTRYPAVNYNGRTATISDDSVSVLHYSNGVNWLALGSSTFIFAGMEYSTWNTANDAANLQSIINNAPVGSTIVLPQSCTLASAITTNKSLVGSGKGHYRFARPTDAQTIVTTNSATLYPIIVNGTGVVIRDFHVRNTATTPTEGSAIKWEGVTDGAGASGVEICHVSSTGFYDGTLYMAGDTTEYSVENCLATNFVRAGYVINPSAFSGDNADGCFINNQAIAHPGRQPLAGFLSFGGGGQKFIGNKVNSEAIGGGPKYGYAMFPKSGVVTSVFIFNGNSFENLQSAGAGIIFDVNPSTSGDQSSLAGQTYNGTIGGITIVGNELAPYQGGSSAYAIRLKGASGNPISSVTVGDNVYVAGCSGVDHDYVYGLTMVGNSHRSPDPLSPPTDFPRHHNTAGHSKYVKTDYGTGDMKRTLWNNSDTSGTVSASDGNTQLVTHQWDITGISASTDFFAQVQSGFSSTRIQVTCMGLAQGSGAFYIDEIWEISSTSSGTNCVPVRVSGTYRNAGVSTTQGSCYAAINCTANNFSTATFSVTKQGSTTSLTGTLTLCTSGAIFKADRLLA